MVAKKAPNDLSEEARVKALEDLAILDTGSELGFDNLTQLAANLFGTRSSAVSLVDKDRQWFKSRHHISFLETARDVALCDHVVCEQSPVVVLDTLEDVRFRNNPLVKGPPNIRFYAGVPITTTKGHCLGSFCILDGQPRDRFTRKNLDLLEGLGSTVAELIEYRSMHLRGNIGAQVVEATPDAVLATNRRAEIVYWNKAAETLFGWSTEEALGKNVTLIIPDKYQKSHQAKFEDAAAGGDTRLVGKFVELEGRKKDQSIFPIELSLAPWGDTLNGGFAAIVRDISVRSKLQTDLDNSRQFLNVVVSNLPSMLFVKDSKTHEYLLVNKKAAELIGRPSHTMIGKRDRELFPKYGPTYLANDLRVISSGEPETVESEFVRDDGEAVNIRTTRVLLDGPDRPNQYLLGLSEDMSEIRRSEAERWRLARFDTLTGLLNRASILGQINALINTGSRFAILSIDLDRFKAVNDQFGHIAGDEVLKEVGSRLNEIADGSTIVARIGGDEFLCLLTGSNLKARARSISSQIITRLSSPIQASRASAFLGASIGVVICPDDGRDLESLRQHADLAMYRAKTEGGNGLCFFDAEMDAAERDRRGLEAALRKAIDDRAIDIAYQPIIEVASGKIASFEALARWQLPQRGAIPPDLFIGLAEDCGLIDELGAQLLEKACKVAREWPDSIKLAVNLSPRQFYSGNLVKTVIGALGRSGLDASRLQLEVTENLVIKNADESFRQLMDLKGQGVNISIDDFGVGYSSLGYFKKFKFDKVKIDKTFITEISTSKAAKAIVSAVVGLANELGIAVVAEGVETVEQRDLLAGIGCSHMQGFLFGEPLSAGELELDLALPI